LYKPTVLEKREAGKTVSERHSLNIQQ